MGLFADEVYRHGGGYDLPANNSVDHNSFRSTGLKSIPPMCRRLPGLVHLK